MILCAFAVAIGSLTVHRIRADFDRDVTATAIQLPAELNIRFNREGAQSALTIFPPLAEEVQPIEVRNDNIDRAKSPATKESINAKPASDPKLTRRMPGHTP